MNDELLQLLEIISAADEYDVTQRKRVKRLKKPAKRSTPTTQVVARKPQDPNKPRPEHFLNGVDYDWHYKLNDVAKSFHDSRAREPRPDMSDARKLHTLVTTQLQAQLGVGDKGLGICSRLEYTGSAYEGVKVAKTDTNKDLEFDVMVIMTGGSDLEIIELEDRPGYVLLKPSKPKDACDEHIRSALDKDDHISADKVACAFLGHLTKCIKKLEEDPSKGDATEASANAELMSHIKERITLRRHGPAVQMDVHKLKAADKLELLADDAEPSVRDATDVAAAENKAQAASSSSDEQSTDAAGAGVEREEDGVESQPQSTAVIQSQTSVVSNASKDGGSLWRGGLFYSVDMVPTFEITKRDGKELEDPEYYVAKPLKPIKMPAASTAAAPGKSSKAPAPAIPHQIIAWRRSFSLKEKQMLMDADKDNGCRKQVLRMLKVIRNSEPGLAQLTSYHLKTVLFRMFDKLPDPQWKSEFLGIRLMDMIGQLEKELESGRMEHYFLPKVNLLESISPKTIENMRQRLKRLKNSEKQMFKKLALKDQ